MHYDVAKKFISVSLSAVLAIGCVPAAAFAEVGNTASNATTNSAPVEAQQGPSTKNVTTNSNTTENVDKISDTAATAATSATESDAATANDDGAMSILSVESTIEATPTLPAAEVTADVAMTLSSSTKNGVIDVDGGSTVNEAIVQLYKANSTLAQRFRFEDAGDGAYTIVAVGSDKVLDVAAGVAKAGTKVQLYQSNGTAAQKWYPVEMTDGSLGFASALGTTDGESLYLSAGALLESSQLSLQKLGAAAQGWNATTFASSISDGFYTISCASDTSITLDISGANYSSGANAQIWAANGSSAQKFKVTFDQKTGYYKIAVVSSGKALDVTAASKSISANVQQYASNNTFAQRWKIEQSGSSYVIKNANSNLALDVYSGKIASGTNVQQYTTNGTAAQAWMFTETSLLEDGVYTINAARNNAYCLDVDSGSKAIGTNIQIYQSNNSSAQKFAVVAYGDTGAYLIANQKSGLVLTAKDEASGSNVTQETLTYSDLQLWTPQLRDSGLVLINKASNRVLDISAGIIENGTNVQVWSKNNTAAQSFVFKKTSTTLSYIAGFSTTAGGNTVRSARFSDTSYLFLGTYADLSALPLTVDTLDGRTTAYYATSEDGAYTQFESGSNLDVLSMDCYNEDTDAYELYVKLNESDAPLKLAIMQSANIPTMYIMSDDPLNAGRSYIDGSPDHSTKASATMVLLEPDGTVTYGDSSSAITIKGRGNATWHSSDKRPYQIKLDKKTDLLNTGNSNNKSKTWVLMANAGDATMLHNSVAFNLALDLGMTESPESEPIDLYYDGVHLGNYLLSEKAEIGSGRVEIEDLDDANEEANPDVDLESLPTATGVNKYGYEYQYVVGVTNPEDTTGGYLVELDDAYYKKETSWFTTSKGAFVIKTPEYASQKEACYISECMQEAIDAMTGEQSVTKVTFDSTSLAKVYLLNEFTKNIDIYCSSTYFYKDAGSNKIYAGPVWDFDTSFGTRKGERNGAIEYGYAGFSTSFRSFAQAILSSGTFASRVREIYEEQFYDLIENVILGDESAEEGTYSNSLSNYASQIASSQRMNQVVWGVTTFVNCINPLSTWEANVEYMKNYTKWRNQWLFSRISTWTETSHSVENTSVEYNGVNYALVYDAQTYLSTYPDLAEAFGGDYDAALDHFVTCGMAEGRQASYNFNVFSYQARYADLQAAFGDDLGAYYIHYINYGFAEGRDAL